MRQYTDAEARAIGGKLRDRLRDALVEAMGRHGLSQQQLARVTTVRQPALSRFLNGASLKVETAAILFDWLGWEVVPKRRR